MNERWHGTSGGYSNHKCKCGPCTKAFAAAHRLSQQKLIANRVVEHEHTWRTHSNRTDRLRQICGVCRKTRYLEYRRGPWKTEA